MHPTFVQNLDRPRQRCLIFAMGSLVVYAFTMLLVLSETTVAASEPVVIDYNRDVRPILSDNCYRCHGPDEGERQTDLRLDDQASAFALMDSGTHAIVAGDSAESELVQRITSDDDDLLMPPPDSGKQLNASQISILQKWIQSGARWGQHWSFVTPSRPKLPQVQQTSWPSNGVDHFVLARLEKEQWQPTVEADKRTLIRRVTFSLTGLPPTPDEVQGYLADDSPDAYARLVDRLLQSPRYGEHFARYWLDVARYGDTHGLHLDNERSIWPYRDWVIDACNQNMPFDQFTIEQLAGDLLPDATTAQRVATGFHRCNVTTSEGGAINEEFLARYAVDRVETTSTVWMGLTTGCAACHDHKFDPISQKEFYQLFAYFHNLTEKAMDGNAKLPPPSVKAPTYVQQVRHRELTASLAEVETQLDQLRAAARADRGWESELGEEFAEAVPPSDAVLQLSFDATQKPGEEAGKVNGSEVGTLVGNLESVPGKVNGGRAFDGKGYIDFADKADFERTGAFSFGAWVNIRDNDAHTVVSKMDDSNDFRGWDLYLSGGKAFVHIISKWDDNALRVNTKLPLRKEKWQHVFATYDGTSRADGVKIYIDGVAQELEVTHDTLTDTIRTTKPLRIGKRHNSAPFVGSIDELNVFARKLTSNEVASLANSNPLAGILKISLAQRTPSQDHRLVDAYLQRSSDDARNHLETLREIQQSISRLKNQFPSTLVMQDRSEPRETFILVRGQYDQKGELVTPKVPAALPASREQSQTRLSLAKWLVDPQHPLTARVTVNRIWQQHFGVGLVKSAGDFGSQGEWPSHPELLDYLATELIKSSWDIKSIHRLIVTSATFKQASQISARAAAEDPENRMLSHGPRFRLDAEMIRDFALATSGLLVDRIGGPSVKPYQPTGLWRAVGYTSSNTANFKRDNGADLYRRGMYTFWKRTSPPPAMQILDAPSREVCVVRRPRTNTPAAALLMMNDVQFVEAARKLAERLVDLVTIEVVTEAKTTQIASSVASPKNESSKQNARDDERFRSAYLLTLARPPSDAELIVLRELLADYRLAYQSAPELATQLLNHGEATLRADEHDTSKIELAAWTMIASTLLNLDEALNQH